MKDLTDVFKTEFIFLHISKQYTDISADVFRTGKEEFTSLPAEMPNVKFDHLYSDELEEGLELSSNSDLLAMTFHHRNLPSRILHHSVAKEISATASCPVFDPADIVTISSESFQVF